MFGEDFENRIFLTFDWDWAPDEVLRYTLDILVKENIAATFFVTHYTPLLDEIRAKHKNIELGIHPNFNLLLEGKDDRNTARILEDIKAIVPEAVCCRSHSLAQSSRILQAYEGLGLKYDLNTYVPFSCGIGALKPYEYLFSVIKIPHFFEDDLYLMADKRLGAEAHVKAPGLKVFDFHPAHIFLNTEEIQRYERAKPYYKDASRFCEFRNNSMSDGTESFIREVIQLAQNKRMQFCRVSEA